MSSILNVYSNIWYYTYLPNFLLLYIFIKFFIIIHICQNYSYLTNFLLLLIFVKIFCIIHICQNIWYYPYLLDFLLLIFVKIFGIIHIY
jgi:hypothetical protein